MNHAQVDSVLAYCAKQLETAPVDTSFFAKMLLLLLPVCNACQRDTVHALLDKCQSVLVEDVNVRDR
ncbi:hypothetical protein IQ22_00948 [Pseudomonas duriflava]|uniref:Uncharacterized protein n=1 Tax=Pseudomonas duriflava TaxID=459528 RepID=A0A562QID8_9PSED|nr:hypothetical protein [Pseudomonas duriflava]TWI56499.1 hypothetical protein IQ22_00948 [Pseudomonas duriflava]